MVAIHCPIRSSFALVISLRLIQTTCFTLDSHKQVFARNSKYHTKPNQKLISLYNMSKDRGNDNQDTLLLSKMHNIGLHPPHLQLILASASPRRREILDMMGLAGKYTVQPSPLDEKALQIQLSGSEIAPSEYARILAERKAAALCDELLKQHDGQGTILILGSDTIVDYNGHILEKPNDKKDAYDMLTMLSGNWHVVHTGVALYGIVNENDESQMQLLFSFTDTAKVKFASLSQDDINSYIATEEPMDKAGSYGIQGIGGQLVECIEGDFFNVMGLPMHRLSKSLNSVISKLL